MMAHDVLPTVVTIERGATRLTLTDAHSTAADLVQMFRQLLAGAGYPESAIERLMPSDPETVTDQNYGGS
jgi:hypothetical protein